ncbi:MAG: hypothetical protein ACR652_10895 [Methylocystis sp.]|uniref:hypothetical protein n=1 Tax=Methylocystis sp. TaxID=1911079 RepID=UPI003DA4952B
MTGLSVKIEVPIAETLKELNRIQRQIPFGVALGLTRTAMATRVALREEMQRVFDRPTPYTLNSMQVTPAKKAALVAAVGFKQFAGKGTPAEKYLAPEIYGGPRNIKRFERALAATGRLPGGMALAPASGVQLDAYGNVSRGTITSIISQLRASSDPMQNQTVRSRLRARGKRAEYFMLQSARGGLKPGVYARHGRSVVPVFHIIKDPSYRPRFEFHRVAEAKVAAVAAEEIAKGIAQAIATAR